MPVTSLTFAVGALALAGIFPFSGFWSKEEILQLASENGIFFLSGALAVSFLTAFYTGRLYFTAFLGPAKEGKKAHDPSWVMTAPLLVLALFSLAGGQLGIQNFLGGAHEEAKVHGMLLALASSAVALMGILFSFLLYGTRTTWAERCKKGCSFIYHVLIRKYFLDDLYDALVKYVQGWVAELCVLFERSVVVELLVNGTAKLTRLGGEILRLLQTGQVQFYAFVVSMGVTLITYFVILTQAK
jgi:NADH-quinone oxidoreductase subunit L